MVARTCHTNNADMSIDRCLHLRDQLSILRKSLTFAENTQRVAICMKCFERCTYCFAKCMMIREATERNCISSECSDVVLKCIKRWQHPTRNFLQHSVLSLLRNYVQY